MASVRPYKPMLGKYFRLAISLPLLCLPLPWLSIHNILVIVPFDAAYHNAGEKA
jgi:hypothetical protein